MRRPASANTSSGNAVPIANAAVRTRIGRPMDAVPPATTMAASTGPAHGTYSAPKVSPSPKPLLPLPV